MKKGVSLIGELLAFLFLIIMAYFLGLTLIYLSKVAGVVGIVGGKANYTLEIEAAILPVKHEYALLSFLESTYQISGKNIPMKKIITATLIQDDMKDVWVDGECINDVGKVSENILDTWSGESPYLLKLKTPSQDLNLVWDINEFKSAKKVLNIQKIRTEIVSPFGNGELILYVSD